MNTDDFIAIAFVILMVVFIIVVIEALATSVFIDNPRNQAFCLDQGFNDWEYASEVTGVNGTIVCIEKGELEYFIYEDGEYYAIEL